MQSRQEILLAEIAAALRDPVADGQIDVLRLTIAAIAMRVTNDPDWLEEMPPDTKEFIRRVFSAAVLLNGAEPTDVTVH